LRSLRSYVMTTLLRLVFKRQKPGSIPVEKQRADFIKMMARTFKPQPHISYQASQLGNVAGDWVRHTEPDNRRTVLYLHGGGYMLGCAEAYRDLTGRLAVAANADLFAGDYRLAPEQPFPAALEDALACYRALITDGVPASSITIAGDSAGGGLTLATLIALRESGDPLPAAAVCLSPWTDLSFSGGSITSNAVADPMLTVGALGYMADNYVNGLSGTDTVDQGGSVASSINRTDPRMSDPRMSPYFGEFHNLPPVLIHVGGDEILLDDARRVAEKINTTGGQSTIKIWPGMPHVWQMFAAIIPEGRQAIAEIGEYIQTNSNAPPITQQAEKQ